MINNHQEIVKSLIQKKRTHHMVVKLSPLQLVCQWQMFLHVLKIATVMYDAVEMMHDEMYV